MWPRTEAPEYSRPVNMWGHPCYNRNNPLVEGVPPHIYRPPPGRWRPVNMWGHPFDQGVIPIVITLLWGVGQERLTPKYRLLHSGVRGWTKKVKHKASRNKRCFTLIQSLMRYSKSHFTNTEAFLTLNVIIHSKVNNMYHRQNQILVFALDTDKTVWFGAAV